ncbi:MAG: hypothetical protein ABIP12_05290 [Terriglobales bacterium]
MNLQDTAINMASVPMLRAQSVMGGTGSKAAPYWEKWTVTRCLIFHGALVALVLLVNAFALPQTTLIVGGVLATPLFLFFVWIEGKKTFLKVTPISIYFMWQAFALGPAAIYAAVLIADGFPTYLGRHLALPTYLAKGYTIGLLGTLFLHAGLQWMRPKLNSLEAPNPSVHQVKALLPILFVMFWAGILMLGFSQSLVVLGILSGLFQFSGHAALLCFILIPSARLALPEFARTGVLLVGTALLGLASTQSNSKFYLMLAFLPMFFYVLQREKMRKHLPAVGALLLFLYLSVIAPAVSGARLIRYKEKVPYTQALWDAVRLYSPLATGRFDTSFYEDQYLTLLKRGFEASSIAVIAEEVDLHGYINGETFYQIRYFFIPRLFWPDKPMMVRGGWFTSYLGNSARETDSTTSIGMEAAGELYWNFGYVGVIAGMFALGAMFGVLWRMSGANPALQPLHMVLYLLNALTMMNIPEAASRMASCILIMLCFGVLFSIMRPRRQSAAQVFRRVESPSRV